MAEIIIEKDGPRFNLRARARRPFFPQCVPDVYHEILLDYEKRKGEGSLELRLVQRSEVFDLTHLRKITARACAHSPHRSIDQIKYF